MTEQDKADCNEILAMVTSGNREETARLIRRYYRDAHRADRTPRSILYLHLGLLTGILSPELD